MSPHNPGHKNGCTACGDATSTGCPIERAVPGPRGRRLVMVAVGYFLVPLLLALAGALWAGPRPGMQLLGALGGLGLGMTAAVMVGRMSQRNTKDDA